MKRWIIYSFLMALFATACEDVYDADLDEMENVLVVEARIIYGADNNYIELSQSLNFNDDSNVYPSINGGNVTLIDSNNNEFELPETSTGNFNVNVELDSTLSYKIKIEYASNTFESNFESVPKPPVLDTVYGVPETQVTLLDGATDISDKSEKEGAMLHADIFSETEMPYYRFTAKKIMQYTYEIEIMMMGEPVPETVYAWKTFTPQETFNIAAPPEYSTVTDIEKHPLYFCEENAYLQSGESFSGWIVVLYQYGLSKSAYDYYADLNNQLESDGRLFDPLYVQARSNISCTNDADQIILGNFEISTIKERRYFVKYNAVDTSIVFKPIPYFYDIPDSGEEVGTQPDFWEYSSKRYPNE